LVSGIRNAWRDQTARETKGGSDKSHVCFNWCFPFKALRGRFPAGEMALGSSPRMKTAGGRNRKHDRGEKGNLKHFLSPIEKAGVFEAVVTQGVGANVCDTTKKKGWWGPDDLGERRRLSGGEVNHPLGKTGGTKVELGS